MDIFKCVGLHDPQLLKNMVFRTVLATRFSSKECDTHKLRPLRVLWTYTIFLTYISQFPIRLLPLTDKQMPDFARLWNQSTMRHFVPALIGIVGRTNENNVSFFFCSQFAHS